MEDSLSSSTSAVEEEPQWSSEADEESISDLATLPKKRKKFSPTAIRGAATYRTGYNSDWEKQYPVGPANDNMFVKNLMQL